MEGLTFYSPYSAMVFNVRHRLDTRHPVTGDIIDTKPAIRVEFAHHAGEFTRQDPDTGAEDTGAAIIGHYFNTAAGQSIYGWSDDEREMVERHLLRRCDELPEFIRLHSDAPAGKPWPKYDEAHHNSIAGLADQLGLVDAALAYERQNKNRDTVIRQLEDKKADSAAEADLVAA